MVFNMVGSYLPEASLTYRGSVKFSQQNVSKVSTTQTVKNLGFVPYAIYGYVYHSNTGNRTVNGCVRYTAQYGWGTTQSSVNVEPQKPGYSFGSDSVSFQPYADSTHGGNVYAYVIGKVE